MAGPADTRIPRVAAAIAYAELRGKRNGWPAPADLWADMSDDMRRDYRLMAAAAIEEVNRHAAGEAQP